jgi:Ca2+-binding EF-hand superfamily protein
MRGQSSGKQSIISKLGKSGFRAQEYERPGVSSDEIQEIKEAFDMFDPEKTGFVSTECRHRFIQSS